MANLDIDILELRRNAQDIRSTSNRLKLVEQVAQDIAHLVGHDNLAAKVRDFGGKWDITKGNLERSLELLADSMEAIADTFEDLDRDLATSARSAVEGEGN